MFLSNLWVFSKFRSLANGINSVNATVWIVECAPPEIRGRMAAMQEFFMAAGDLSITRLSRTRNFSSLYENLEKNAGKFLVL